MSSVPAWTQPALEAVIDSGFDAGDADAAWDIADRWYALADAVAEPREQAFVAAEEILAGLPGVGIPTGGFRDAWQRLTGDDDAPLNVLGPIAHGLGEMVDRCGRDMEAAALAAQAEIETFLIDLIGIGLTAELTQSGAAGAIDALVTSTQSVLSEIDDRLRTNLAGLDDRPQPALGENNDRPRTDLGGNDNRPHPALGENNDSQRTDLGGNDDHPQTGLGDTNNRPRTDLAGTAHPTSRGGGPARRPDPREGDWFAELAGDVADPGLDAIDTVLALFDAYVKGQPRDPRPRGSDWPALHRIPAAAGGDFQTLCSAVGNAEPAMARRAVDAALEDLAGHLHESGHGAFAFLLTDLEEGGRHCWAAVNHAGTILFLDPVVGRISADEPLYSHRGSQAPGNVVALYVLVVNSHGRPAPLPPRG